MTRRRSVAYSEVQTKACVPTCWQMRASAVCVVKNRQHVTPKGEWLWLSRRMDRARSVGSRAATASDSCWARAYGLLHSVGRTFATSHRGHAGLTSQLQESPEASSACSSCAHSNLMIRRAIGRHCQKEAFDLRAKERAYRQLYCPAVAA